MGEVTQENEEWGPLCSETTVEVVCWESVVAYGMDYSFHKAEIAVPLFTSLSSLPWLATIGTTDEQWNKGGFCITQRGIHIMNS